MYSVCVNEYLYDTEGECVYMAMQIMLIVVVVSVNATRLIVIYEVTKV